MHSLEKQPQCTLYMKEIPPLGKTKNTGLLFHIWKTRNQTTMDRKTETKALKIFLWPTGTLASFFTADKQQRSWGGSAVRTAHAAMHRVNSPSHLLAIPGNGSKVQASPSSISCMLLLLLGLAPKASGRGHLHGTLQHMQYFLSPPPARYATANKRLVALF